MEERSKEGHIWREIETVSDSFYRLRREGEEKTDGYRASWRQRRQRVPSGPFSSRLSGLPVGFSIPIQRGASEPNYYDSSPLDSVGPFDLPPFSMIPRYLGRAHCVLPVEGDPRAADRYGGVAGGPRTYEWRERDAINYSSMSAFFSPKFTLSSNFLPSLNPSSVDHTRKRTRS